MDDVIALLDPNLVVIEKKINKKKKKITLWVRMKNKETVCPECGATANTTQGKYWRHLKDCNLMGYQVDIFVETRKFYCRNEQCSRKTFAEPLPFADPFSRKTNRAWKIADELHAAMSSVEAAEILSENDFPIHPSTLQRHMKKHEDEVEPDRELVTMICIDDFAMRTRFSYGTAFIDAITRELLEIIPSRRAEDVAKALEKYPNLILVSRDGASCFKNAVLTLPNGKQIIQCRDPFHIHMNGTDACLAYLKARLPLILPLSGPIEKKPAQLTSEALEARKLRIRTAQELHSTGASVKEIASIVGVCEGTVRRYLKTDPDTLESGNRQKYEKLLPHLKKIGELNAAGAPATTILEAIRERGYQGSKRTFDEYMAGLKAGNIRIPTEDSITRATLLKRLYKPLEEIHDLDEEDYRRALEHYPFVGEVFEWMDKMRSMFEKGCPSGLEDWLNQGETFKSKAIESYVNGLRGDIDAVKASILLPISNGPMEGTVNKIKVDKRIMFGRCGFPYFRVKTLYHERLRRARQERLAQRKMAA